MIIKYNPINIAKDLINFPSITPKNNGAIEYIENILKNEGFKTIKKEFGKDYKVTNLYAKLGNTKNNLCFAGHVDVVSPVNKELWKFDPFTATIDQEYLYGRGAVDMKGSLAAMISAVMDYKNNYNFNGSISFLITSDEEGEALYGTKKMLEYIYSIGETIDMAIVGEPTSEKKLGDVIKIGRRGSINFKLTVLGKQCHVAYPEKGINPNHKAIKILNKLINIKIDQGNEYFEPSNLEITSINSFNKTTNIIPNNTEIMFNIRYNNIYTEKIIINKIRQIVETTTTNYQLTYSSNAKPFLSQPKTLLKNIQEAIKDITSTTAKVQTNGGTSDARFLSEYTDVIEIGLLSETAHQIDEKTKILDINKLYKIYLLFLKNSFR